MSIIKSEKKIILASASKIREKILKRTNLIFKVVEAEVDEEQIKLNLYGKKPDAIATFLAKCKANSVSQLNPDSYVIGCDQICFYNKKIIDKPKTASKAIEQLNNLNGKTHRQYSAVVISFNGKDIWTYSEFAELTMKKLSKKSMLTYIKEDKPFQSCGSYRFESLGCHLFSKVVGSNDTIQGLPLVPLLHKLYELEIYSIQ